MEGAGGIHIGTSGWHYEHWVGRFYPSDIGKESFLHYYSQFFHTVEINNSFYRLPSRTTFEHWRDAVPAGFIFAVKASRFITHMKRLKDPEKSLSAFMERVQGLQGKLGVILFQLPPRMSLNLERLEYFLSALPAQHRCAFEFRDPAWFHPDVFAALSRHKAAFCVYELAGLHSPREITADFIYIRLHGPGDAYSGCYSLEALAGWARDICRWAERKTDIYCYFDNDEVAYAAQNARELHELVTRGATKRDGFTIELRSLSPG